MQDTYLIEDPASGAVFGTQIGPGFFQSIIAALPNSTVFNMDLNLGNYSYANALAEAKAARQYLGDQLTSFSSEDRPRRSGGHC